LIDVKITGDLPEVNEDREQVMAAIGDIMLRSGRQNFLEQGRPNPWPPTKSGGSGMTLIRSGHLFESIQAEWNENEATVFVDTGTVPYALIHNFGGVIQYPGDGDPYDINMPQREYMMFQDEDITEILELYGNALFTKTEPLQ